MTTTTPRTDEAASVDDERRQLAPFAAKPVLTMAGATVAVLVALSTRYGYHRDEFYYVWGGEHLDWGFVDHPPLVPLVARVADVIGGHTLVALRTVAALIAGWLIVAGALIARELGGGRRAQALAAFATMCVPATRAPEILYGTTAADAAVWAVLLVLAVRLLRTNDTRQWLWIGLVAGIGFETKWSVGVLVAGLLIGLLLTPQRRLLWSGWALAGGAIALALWAPNLWWNATHDWPFLEFQRHVAEDNGSLDKRLLFFPLLLLLTGLAPIVVWWPGWTSLHRSRFRALSIACIAMTVAVFVAAGKPYYLAPMFLPLLAAGAVALDRGPLPRRRTAVWVLAITGLVTIPLTLPVLPARSLNAIKPINKEMGEMVGWPELVTSTRTAFNSLSPSEREQTVIVTSNYGSAGVLQRDAPDLPVFTAQNSQWYTGPPPATATTMVTVGYSHRYLESICGSIEQVGLVTNDVGVDNEEANRPIFACRQLTQPWPALWNELKHFD